MNHRVSSILAIAPAFVGATLAAAWIVGPLDEPAAESARNYILEPPDLPGLLEVVLGTVGLVMMVAAGLAAWSRRPLRAVWGIASVGGLVAGICYRLVTASTDGANIGGGLALIVGVPLVAGLLCVAIVTAAIKGRDQPSSGTGEHTG